MGSASWRYFENLTQFCFSPAVGELAVEPSGGRRHRIHHRSGAKQSRSMVHLQTWEQIRREGLSMDYINNKGEKFGSLDIAISKDKSVTINRLNDVTNINVRDRHTGNVTSDTFFGDSPFGK
jgi:hypothetical protein